MEKKESNTNNLRENVLKPRMDASTEEKNRAVALIVENLKQMNPGTIVPWTVLEQLVGCTKREDLYPLLSRVKKEMAREGIFLSTQHNVGYKIVPRGEEWKYTKGIYFKGIKVVKKAIVYTNAINISAIKDEASRITTIAESQKMSNVYGLLGQS